MTSSTELSLPALYSVPECAVDLVAWQLPAGPRLTVVAKIAFALVNGEIKDLLPLAAEIIEREQHYERSPTRSLQAASDLSPILPRAEVIVVGHAYSPQGRATPSLTVQVQVARKNQVLLKKRIQVLGDRAAPGAQPSPFQRMPLVWERALKTDMNPVGTAASPNLVDMDDPTRAAGFGPLASSWSERRARLKDLARGAVETEPMVLPAGFDFGFFQAAPADQQLASLTGSEWVALDGLHPLLPRIQLKLPACTIAVRLVDPTGRPQKVTPLIADRLVIDSDRQIGTLTYRGGLTANWNELAGHRIEVGLSKGGETISFPSIRDPRSLRARRRQGVASVSVVAMTALPPTTAPDPALPFPAAPESASARAPANAPKSLTELQAPPAGAQRPSRKQFVDQLPDVTLDDSEPHQPPSRPTSSPAPDAPKPFHAALPDMTIDDAGGGGPALPFGGPQPPERVVVRPGLSLPTGTAKPVDTTTRSLDLGKLGAEPVPFAQALGPGPSSSGGSEGLPFGPPPSSPGSRPVGDEPAREASAPPPRKSLDSVPTVSDAGFAVMSFAWQIRPPKESLVLVVKGSFDLVQNEAAKPRTEAELPRGDVFVDDDLDKALVRASDLAIMKLETDILVTGHAYATGGKGTATQATLRMRTSQGVLEQSIAVFGDRVWQGGAMQVLPSSPEPFEKIPLSYERAFGGPGYAANPVGVGHKGAAGPDGVRRLPNFEIPTKLVKSPGDTPAPAGLGPIHPQWKARWSLVGTYDSTWFKTRWPYYPDDFDYRFFQSAPVGLRAPKVAGDEEFELVSLHAKHGSLRGRLPGLRVRAFAVKTQAAGGAFVEVAVKLDTITFAPDEDALHLVWRGNLEVSDDDAPELERIFATAEPLGGPALTLDDVRARYVAALAEPVEEPAPEEPPEEPEAASVDEDAEEERKLEESLAAEIAKVEALAPPADPDAEPPPLPEPDPDAVVRALREAGSTEEEVAEMLAALTASPETEFPPAPPIDLRELVKARIAEGEPLSDLDLRGADLSDLDLSSQSLARSDLTDAKLMRADLSGSDASDAHFASADLEGATLEGTLLCRADLEQTKLEGANLKGALLDGAEARGASFVGCDLTGAMLAEVIFEGADLRRAVLDGSSLKDADLTGTRLDAATFRKATMTAVRLYDARGERAVFDGADMTNARADGATLVDCSFRDVFANDSQWERADLSRSTFIGATLTKSLFLRAVCSKSTFSGADLTGARLEKSKLSGASLLRTNLMGAKLDRANLDLADLRGANLHAASLHRTSLENAKLEGAIVTFSRLENKQW